MSSRRSTARLPPSEEAHRLCAPASRRVCLYRDAGAPTLVRTIIPTWRPLAYRPHGHFSQPRQARLYARCLLWRGFDAHDLNRNARLRTSPLSGSAAQSLLSVKVGSTFGILWRLIREANQTFSCRQGLYHSLQMGSVKPHPLSRILQTTHFSSSAVRRLLGYGSVAPMLCARCDHTASSPLKSSQIHSTKINIRRWGCLLVPEAHKRYGTLGCRFWVLQGRLSSAKYLNRTPHLSLVVPLYDDSRWRIVGGF